MISNSAVNSSKTGTFFQAVCLSCVFAFASTSAYAADASFDRTLNLSGPPMLSVATGSGSIHLHAGSDSQMHIIGHIHGNKGWMSGSDVDARIREIAANPPIAQSGNQVTVGDRHNNDLYRSIGIDYDISLPRNSTITASSGSGDVDIQDVGSSLKAETGSGNLNVANLDGAVTVQTGSGDVKAESLGSGAKLGTGSGTIDAEGMRGAVSLDTGSGDIRLQQNGSAEVKAQTGSGSIRANGVNGGLKAGTGSGDIEINGQPTADWKLDSGSGSIRLGVGNGAKFTLNAETGSGTVHVDQPITMQGDLNRHHVRGAVNGGGVMVRAETGSGDISIR